MTHERSICSSMPQNMTSEELLLSVVLTIYGSSWSRRFVGVRSGIWNVVLISVLKFHTY